MSKYGKWLLTAVTLLWCVFIWQFSLAPATVSAGTSGNVLGFCNEVLENAGVPIRLTGQMVRKMAHFAEFFVLGVLSSVCLLAHGFRHWQLLSGGVFLPVAVIDECIQLFVPGRGPHVLDVLLDVVGAICGTAAFYLLVLLIIYIKNKKNKKISKTP